MGLNGPRGKKQDLDSRIKEQTGRHPHPRFFILIPAQTRIRSLRGSGTTNGALKSTKTLLLKDI